MTTRRALLLITLGVVVAGLLLVQRDPVDNPPASTTEPTPAPLLNLPGPSPAASAVSASATSAVPPPAPPQRIASAGAAPRIGAEGYGPHIERAWSSTDAAAAWEAVQWLRQCESNEARRNSFEQARNQGVAPEMMTQMMVEADEQARRCQTVTAQHRALLPELASRAMRGGVPEAASAYANAVFARDLSAAQRQEVADAMRRDALAGHAQSLLAASLSNPEWGLSDAERLAFLHAFAALPDPPGGPALLKQWLEPGRLGLKSTPTLEQLAAAREAGRRIAERATRPGQR